MKIVKISPLVSIITVLGLAMGEIIIPSVVNQAAATTNVKLAQVNNGISPQLLINQRAMTIIGQGQVTAPADTALLEMRFVTRQLADTPVAGLQLPAGESSEDQATLLALKPVVDALVAIKIPTKDITVQPNSVDNPRVQVKLSKPTRDRVQQVVAEVNKTLRNNNQVVIQSVGVEYGVRNCQPLERQARRIALSDAQAQMKSFAADLGVEAGDILFVTVYPTAGSATSSSCGGKVGVPVSPFALSSDAIAPYDPSASPEVQVRSQVSVTYAINPLEKGNREQGR